MIIKKNQYLAIKCGSVNTKCEDVLKEFKKFILFVLVITTTIQLTSGCT